MILDKEAVISTCLRYETLFLKNTTNTPTCTQARVISCASSCVIQYYFTYIGFYCLTQAWSL